MAKSLTLVAAIAALFTSIAPVAAATVDKSTTSECSTLATNCVTIVTTSLGAKKVPCHDFGPVVKKKT
jgi:hypothetical protein